MNRFSTPDSELSRLQVVKNPVVHVKLAATDITRNDVSLEMKGFVFAPADKLLANDGTLDTPEVRIADENIGAYALTPSWKKIGNADFYEIEFNGMLYSSIRNTELLFEDLRPETKYTFKVRAVNASGTSDWADINVTTQSDPLEFAIRGIEGETTCPNQGGQGINKLFNFDEGDTWHTKWGMSVVPSNS